MAIDASEIVTAFGDYYINEGQNMNRLRQAIRQPAVTPSYATPIIHESDLYRSSNSALGEIVQQFQKAFTAKGNLTFHPNEIRLRNAKIDISLYPDDVKGKWLGFLASLDDQERKNWPIVRYLLEKHVVPQIPHDMETKAYWGGSYVAPTPGTAGTAAGTIDGLKKQIDAGLLDGSMNAVVLSNPITPTTIFDGIEEFSDAIDPVLASQKIQMFMSPLNLKRYFRDKRNTHGTDQLYDGKTAKTVDFSENIELVALPSMAGSDYIWATPKDNFLHLRKVNGMSTPKVEESKREVFLMLDWYEAIGFDYNALVYVYKPS